MRALPFGSAPWSLKLPSDFSGTTLTLPVPAGQRLAVTLLNIGDVDLSGATIEVTGTAAAARAPTAPPLASLGLASPGRWQPLPLPFRPPPDRPWSSAAPEPRLASTAGAALASTSFCTRAWGPTGDYLGFVRRHATLVRESATAAFYVDDANAAEYSAADWDTLVAAWETVYAQITNRTGPAPDVDGDGKMALFFTGAMGAGALANVTPWLELSARDTSPTCSVSGGNAVDLINLHAPNGYPDPAGGNVPPEVVLSWMPYAMAHELNHLVDYQLFCLSRADCGLEEWLSEGRAQLSALGFQISLGRNEIFQRSGPAGGYGDLQLIPWGDSILAYAGVPSFLLYLVDRFGPAFRSTFVQEVNTLAQLEATSGLPFPVAYGLWTSALLFSNEPANPWPVLDYTGADWTPLHQKYQRFEYGPLSPGTAVPVTLRQNGFDVYVTGVADAGGGTVTITSSAAVKPHVVAVPFSGALP
jgi:hypothetical protein